VERHCFIQRWLFRTEPGFRSRGRTASSANSFVNHRCCVIEFLIAHGELSTFPKQVQSIRRQKITHAEAQAVYPSARLIDTTALPRASPSRQRSRGTKSSTVRVGRKPQPVCQPHALDRLIVPARHTRPGRNRRGRRSSIRAAYRASSVRWVSGLFLNCARQPLGSMVGCAT
jgi:hypothetical protein